MHGLCVSSIVILSIFDDRLVIIYRKKDLRYNKNKKNLNKNYNDEATINS